MEQLLQEYLENKIIYKVKKEISKEINDLKEQLNDDKEAYNEYIYYINKYFISNIIFDFASNVDIFWKNQAKKFVLSCFECQKNSIEFKDLVKYVIDFDIKKSGVALDKLKKYDKNEINSVLDASNNTRDSIFTIIKNTFKEYSLFFDETDEYYYSFKAVSNNPEKKLKVINSISKEIMNLLPGSEFYLGDFLGKYELNEEEMSEYSLEIIRNNHYIEVKENDGDKSLFECLCKRVNIEVLKNFVNLKYEFYIHNSHKKFKAKLSPNHIVIIYQDKYGIVDDAVVCKKMYSDFLLFVKKATKYKKATYSKDLATGVVVDVHWASGIKNTFSKLPNPDETIDYLLEKLVGYIK